MRFLAPVLVLTVSLAGVCAWAGAPERFGPADNPEVYPDWGGTPDLTISGELGLSPGEIEEILKRVVADDRQTRVAAALELRNDAPGSEEGIREVLWSGHGARNAQMREVMAIARRRLAAEPETEGGLMGVLLAMDPKHSETGEGARACMRVASLLSALMSLNTMAGYKVMLEFSGRHAGVFRQLIGDMITAGGMKVIPALVYGRGSKDDELHMFAVKWIRDMGNPLLGEQIGQIDNPRRLAQLLEAYASVNELDAVDVTLSLANHESIFVRRAARRCLEVYGANAKWSARRVYENTFGEDPKDGTDEADWLRALYERWDKERIAGALSLMEEGLAAAGAGDFEKMEKAYREILRESPMFPRRHEMADGLLKLASKLEDDERFDDAEEISLLAFRVAEPGSDSSERARARLDWLRAEMLRKKGLFDEALYKQVAESDPENSAAARWATEYAPDPSGREGLVRKGVIVSGIVFLAMALVALRLRRRERG